MFQSAQPFMAAAPAPALRKGEVCRVPFMPLLLSSDLASTIKAIFEQNPEKVKQDKIFENVGYF